MWKSLVHPQGALRRILIDPVMSNHKKVQRVVGDIATRMVGTLIIVCTIVPDPTGISPIAATALKAVCPRFG